MCKKNEGTFGRAVDWHGRQGHKSQARRDVEATRWNLHDEITTLCSRTRQSLHGGIGFALDVRDSQVAQVHWSFKVDDHFFHVKGVRNFNLHAAINRRKVSLQRRNMTQFANR